MTASSRPGLRAIPVAADNAQLRHAQLPTHFDPELEADYVRTRLLNARTLIRMACPLGLIIALLRIIELAVTGGGMPVRFPGAMITFPLVVLFTSALLTWFAWRQSFVRKYLPVANFAVPARNVCAGIAIAAMVARGEGELLMALPVLVLSPFFFLGLQWRSALACVVLTIAAFAAAALVFALPAAVLLRTCGFLIVTAATSAVAAWQLEKQSRRSFLENRLIAQLAEHDALTGAKNRRVFDEHLDRLWQQAIDDGRPLAVLLIDADHFKGYNDRYGHQAGDVALQRVAQAVQAQISRPLDMLSRYGGEEFAVLLYDIDGRQAREIAERMRLAVSALGLEHRGSRVARVVTVSVGVAAIQPLAGRRSLGALQLADEMLYKAKVNGRNNVQFAAESEYDHLQTGVFAQQDISPTDGQAAG
jgi:diguanylate cyclase (GGDEF)-like protein